MPVGGRGQSGVIQVIKHPQYGGNPASPSLPFVFRLPSLAKAKVSKTEAPKAHMEAPAPAPTDLPLRAFLANEGLDDLHDPLHELGAESLSDLADVTDAEFAECGIPQEKGEWLRRQAQAAVRGGGSGGGVGSGVGAAGIPEGVPKEDEDDGV